MPSLTEQITIPLPLAEVWPLLADPALVASCVPGASLSATDVLGVYQGTIRVRFGPTTAVFRGEARIAYHPDTLSCTVEGSGRDAAGQSRGIASGLVVAGVGDDNDTVIHVESEFEVTGPLAVLVHSAGAEVARQLLSEFAQCLTKLLTDEGTPAPEAEEIPIVEPQTAGQQARAVAAASEASGHPQANRPGLIERLLQTFSRKR